jgi:hypothetical protein
MGKGFSPVWGSAQQKLDDEEGEEQHAVDGGVEGGVLLMHKQEGDVRKQFGH